MPIRRFCFLVVLLSFCLPSQAEIMWYHIELVVFENKDIAGFYSENWPDDPGVPNRSEAITVVNPAISQGQAFNDRAKARALARVDLRGMPTPFRALASSQLRLNSTANRLVQSGRYRVLVHAGWLQPLDRGGASQTVRIHSRFGVGNPQAYEMPVRPVGTPEDDLMQQTETMDPTLNPAADAPPPVPLPATGDDVQIYSLVSPLDGTATLTLSRYMHLQLDLVYQKKIEARFKAADGQLGPVEERKYLFRMKSSRRMKSQEYHYLDHPIIGAIAYINRYVP